MTYTRRGLCFCGARAFLFEPRKRQSRVNQASRKGALPRGACGDGVERLNAYSEVEIPRGRIAPWLADPLRRNRDVYVKVGFAAAMINLFGLVSSLFTMTVYDRVIPNNAFDSLVEIGRAHV